MFKFNFITDNDDKEKPKNDVTETKAEPKSVSKHDECHEIFPSKKQAECDYFAPNLVRTLKCITFPKHNVYHVPIEDIISKLVNEFDDIGCAEQNHSDLIAGIYEGGAKVWECTETVGDYLTRPDGTQCLIDQFEDSTVLDLGCGAGILGILVLQAGATVHFQDYNKTVLEHITIPNVLVNTKSIEKLKERCRFYSGDWSNYTENTEDGKKFDFILTSETIYNAANYEKLINVIKTKLKPDGACYLAAKLHYFGVGGSLREFEQTLLKTDIFKSETVFTCNDNIAREILKITFK
ncbi:histidine protein methyltransferase 1 homolog [Contarinia nasturtii]|uniref:histidine protein methyltransferase 1 homolog n=1 Tax=Contarinia nasturtii TaxID=265458 RepID=UPI0012D3E6CB|nr:histidine protein methyltransferase 1 homolog [Contarinia nasturtii]